MDVTTLRNSADPQVDLHPMTVIHGGMCARVILVPAGTCAAGATLQLSSILSVYGDVSLACGEAVTRLTGFNLIPGTAGDTRAVYAHEDSFIMCTHRTDELTLAGAAAEMVGQHTRLLDIGQLFLGGSQ